jgi:hypothetical protein
MSLYELMKANDMEDCNLAPYVKMVSEETAKGFTCIHPGDVDWLPKEEWPENVVMSLSGKIVRVIAIYARNPGTGSFGRLITAIAKAGLKPIVLLPGDHMLRICKAWGWVPDINGAAMESWFEPTEEWLKQRAATGSNVASPEDK